MMLTKQQLTDGLRKWLYSVRGDNDISGSMESMAKRMVHEGKWNELKQMFHDVIDERDRLVNDAEAKAEAKDKSHRAEVRSLKKQISQLEDAIKEETQPR